MAIDVNSVAADRSCSDNPHSSRKLAALGVDPLRSSTTCFTQDRNSPTSIRIEAHICLPSVPPSFGIRELLSEMCRAVGDEPQGINQVSSGNLHFSLIR